MEEKLIERVLSKKRAKRSHLPRIYETKTIQVFAFEY